MPGDQNVSPPMLGVILANMSVNLISPIDTLCYPAVKTASSYIHSFERNTGV